MAGKHGRCSTMATTPGPRLEKNLCADLEIAHKSVVPKAAGVQLSCGQDENSGAKALFEGAKRRSSPRAHILPANDGVYLSSAIADITERRMQRAPWAKIAVVAGFWTLMGVYSAIQSHYRSQFGRYPLTWPRAIWVEMAYVACGGLFTPWIFWLARRYRLECKPYWRGILIHALGATAFAAVIKLLWDVLVQPPTGWIRSGFTFKRLLIGIDSGLDYGIALYLLVLLMIYAVEYYQRYEAGLVNAATLQTQLVQAQLHSLKMQLHPHFLFNTLHTISALVQEDPEAAERMIARLSELLRLSLESAGAQEVTLRQELDFLDLYLEIEQTRFEDRLTVKFEIDPDTESALVP